MKTKPTLLDQDPGKMSRVIMDTLRRAGYALESDAEIQLGRIAFQSALLVSTGLSTDSDQAAKGIHFVKVGRNAPCPCSSGKKFKKCCMGKENNAGNRSRKKSDGLTPDPAVIPNISDEEEVMRDIAVLDRLFRTETGLKTVRYPREEAAEFLDEFIEANPELPEDEFKLEQQMDKIAHRFDKNIDGGKLMGSLTDELIDAASRVQSTEEKRSLALGLFLTALYKIESKEPSPLVRMIFMLSATERIRLHASIKAGIERLGGVEVLKNRLLEDDPNIEHDLEAFTAGLDPEVIDAMRDEFDRDLSDAEKYIKSGKFPVPFPYVTVLPFHLKLHRSDKRGEPDADWITGLVVEFLEELEPEDFRLYRQHLKEWLKSDAENDKESAPYVAFVHNMTITDKLFPLDFYLLLYQFKSKSISVLEGERDLLPHNGENPDTPEFLERYADFFEKKGYPALAERTRNLA